MLLHGLAARPELNGQAGTCLEWHGDKERYSVRLNGSSETVKVRPCNLQPAAAAPAPAKADGRDLIDAFMRENRENAKKEEARIKAWRERPPARPSIS